MAQKERQLDIENLEITIDRVVYSHLVNLGNYENERVEAEAKVIDGLTPEQVVEQLKNFVHAHTHSREKYDQWCSRYWQQKNELEKLEMKVREAQDMWAKASTFLVAQGLKRTEDLPEFPVLPPSKSEPEPDTAEFVDDENLDDIPL